MKYTRKTHIVLYKIWAGMKNRCKPSRWIIKPSYEGCELDYRWNDFQIFAEDYTNMIGYGLPNRQLDKDILFKGNKLYSPDTCVLVPKYINTLLTHNKSTKNQCCIGVKYIAGRKHPYLANIHLYGKYTYLGQYDTIDEAFDAYKKVKENHIKEVANKHKSEIDIRVYTALCNWTISKND